jgi:hypothetical protein
MIKVLKQMVEALEHELCIDWTNDEEFNASAEKMHDAIQAGKKAIAELESQETFEDLASELFVVAQVSPADNGFSETIERIESWLQEHFTHLPQRTEEKNNG